MALAAMSMAICITPAFGEMNPSSVFFNTHEVRLGAPVLKAITDLSAFGFTFQAPRRSDGKGSLTVWIVWPPANRSDPGGFLYVRDDIIVGIEHRLSRSETLKDVYGSLFNALSDISKEGAATCSVRTVRHTLSNGTLTLMSIGCGGITITVDHVDFKGEQGKIDQSYEVTETIGVVK